MNFSEWKKAVLADGWFKTHSPSEKAVYVMLNAHVSKRAGEMTPRAFTAAKNWAYNLDHGAAWLEERRQETREKQLVS